MKETSKPKENWESTIKGSRKIFKSEDYKKILRDLNIPFTDETIKKIIDTQAQYCDEIQLIDDRPKMSEVRAMMKKIIHHGKKYKEWLNKIDDASLEKMAVAMHDKNLMDDINMRGLIDRSLKDVIYITGLAELVIENWKLSQKDRKPSHPFDLSIRGYIARLAQIFKEATGKKATVTTDPEFWDEDGEDGKINVKRKEYKGKFPDFVSFCYNKIPDHRHIANSTFATYVKEVTSPSRNLIKIS